jgi:hypothetical protein
MLGRHKLTTAGDAFFELCSSIAKKKAKKPEKINYVGVRE